MGRTRDRFIAAALQGVIAGHGMSDREGLEGIARRAVKYADAIVYVVGIGDLARVSVHQPTSGCLCSACVHSVGSVPTKIVNGYESGLPRRKAIAGMNQSPLAPIRASSEEEVLTE